MINRLAIIEIEYKYNFILGDTKNHVLSLGA